MAGPNFIRLSKYRIKVFLAIQTAARIFFTYRNHKLHNIFIKIVNKSFLVSAEKYRHCYFVIMGI